MIVKICEVLHQYDSNKGSFVSWLLMVIRTNVYQAWKKSYNRHCLAPFSSLDEPLNDETESKFIDLISSPRPLPDMLVIFKQLYHKVRNILVRRRAKYKPKDYDHSYWLRLLYHHYVLGYTVGECAERFNHTYKGTSYSIHRAVTYVRERLGTAPKNFSLEGGLSG
jgi:DNA-directed RNA polymerase specialized sigma24 family protein